MINIPVKVKNRLVENVKKYKQIVKKAQLKDDNEANTVKIITNILSEVFGYDEFEEITSEYMLKGHYCDLAIKLDETPKVFIEVKAVGVSLRDTHKWQVTTYALQEGVSWAILTNGVIWQVYRVFFDKKAKEELLFEFNFTELSTRKESDIELLYLLTKEAMTKGQNASLGGYYAQQQTMNRFMVSACLISEPVLNVVRKSLKKIASDAKITNDELKKILLEEVIKRDILEDDKFKASKKKIAKMTVAATKAKQNDKIIMSNVDSETLYYTSDADDEE